MVKSGISGIVTKGYNSTPTTSYGSTFGNEITFEQFKKYVLKEDVEVLEEPKDKVLLSRANSNHNSQTLTITKVESSEGAIYQLGDKIRVFTKDSSNKSKVFTIKGFRWNNAKTNICAITELHTTNGIGLDKIELYSEPVIKIVEDFKLPEKWCVKRTIDNYKIINNWCNNNYINNESYSYVDAYNYIYSEEPINAMNSYKRRTYLSYQDLSFTEITFEQFEQYVLHNGFKVGDRFTKQKYFEVTEKEIIALEYIGNCSIAVYKYTSNNYTSPQCRILTKNIVK